MASASGLNFEGDLVDFPKFAPACKLAGFQHDRGGITRSYFTGFLDHVAGLERVSTQDRDLLVEK